MADHSIDPRLLREAPSPELGHDAEPRDEAGADDGDSASEPEAEGHDGRQKRQKLNLWKCKQCRDARRKCFPVGRVWPQKCERCLQHRPELPCSQPELNSRKRGPNITKPARRVRTRLASEVTEPQSRDKENESSAEETFTYDRPVRLVKRFKREPRMVEPSSPSLQPAHDGKPNPSQVAFPYLELQQDEFRLLQLAPGKKDDAKLVGSFLTASVHDPPAYEAISYVWGGNEGAEVSPDVIELQDAASPPQVHTYYLRSNIHAALRALRRLHEPQLFWIDALCINRSGNMPEVNQQVTMKREIFHKSKNVCFWLGEEANSKAALDFIPRMLDVAVIDDIIRDTSTRTAEGWSAFVALLKNRAFSRLWFVQEVAVARNVTIHCGEQAIHYADFVDAVTMFSSRRNDICRHQPKLYGDLNDRRIAMAERFVDVTSNALRWPKGSNVSERLLSLEDLVSQLSDFTSSNPKDRIFAVLALAKDGLPWFEDGQAPAHETRNPPSIEINYDRSLQDIYEGFFAHVVKNSESLNIICQRWSNSVPENAEQLPTWVRPLHSFNQLHTEDMTSGRIDADVLVGLPGKSFYDASKGHRASKQLQINDQYLIKHIIVDGFPLDEITGLGPRALEGIISYEWLELGGCVLSDEVDPIPERFWRTLVADRGLNGSHAPSWYHLAFLHCLERSTPTGDIETKRIIEDCGQGYSFVVEFLRRVQSVIWNRKFLVTKDNRIGLAPMAAREGDVICILYGCTVPVVLRPSDGSRTHWSVIGECYLHGMMDGEAIERHQGGPVRLELI
ncbi:hypothetical protein BP5796_12416 [Coleophoma crateriformis]|uniref:Heterokaryon incompatibility domain-containing protein n=1 Tax=Coleophoma crateriformis TaxID=565419 RepID=A0A3D8Q9I8_9HELO|nr:hypothetical protein BP5796_12416 [Coleophoma crateriformis]